MTEGLDEGPVLADATVRIGPLDTAGTLHDRMAAAGAELLVRDAGRRSRRGRAVETPQADEGVTYAKKIRAEGGADRLGQARRARSDRKIRGLSPFPGAWFELPTRARARCGSRRCCPRSRTRPGAPGRCWTTGCWSPAARARCGCCGCSARAAGRRTPRPSCAACPAGRDEARLMPRYRLHRIRRRPLPWLPGAGGAAVGAGRRWSAAIKGFCGEDAAACTPPGGPTPACTPPARWSHIDLAKDWPAETVRNALNAHLVPEPIAVLEAEVADGDFHARFSATGRRYLYRILNRASPPALDQGRVWHVKKPLDAEAMHAAAQVLVGHHDFTTFRDLKCQAKSPMKTLDVAAVSRDGEEVMLEFASRSFLHRQVRSMIGIAGRGRGSGRWTRPTWRRRWRRGTEGLRAGGAPAEGLYLTGVEYGGPPPASAEDAEDEEDKTSSMCPIAWRLLERFRRSRLFEKEINHQGHQGHHEGSVLLGELGVLGGFKFLARH